MGVHMSTFFACIASWIICDFLWLQIIGLVFSHVFEHGTWSRSSRRRGRRPQELLLLFFSSVLVYFSPSLLLFFLSGLFASSPSLLLFLVFVFSFLIFSRLAALAAAGFSFSTPP